MSGCLRNGGYLPSTLWSNELLVIVLASDFVTVMLSAQFNHLLVWYNSTDKTLIESLIHLL